MISLLMKCNIIRRNLNKKIYAAKKWQSNNVKDGDKQREEQILLNKLNDYSKNRDLKEEQLNQITKQKIRMKKIIEICDINNNENEKYINSLDELKSKYFKMYEFQKKELIEKKQKIFEVQNIITNYVKKFNDNIEHNYKLIDRLKENFSNKKQIESLYESTEHVTKSKIKEYIKEKKKIYNEKTYKQKKIQDKIDNEKKIKVVNNELNKYKAIDEDYNMIFDYDKNEYNNYMHNPKFIKLIENLDLKKDYEYKLIEENDKNEKLKKKKEEILKKINEFKLLNNNIKNHDFDFSENTTKLKYENNKKIDEINLNINKEKSECLKVMNKRSNMFNAFIDICDNNNTKISSGDFIFDEKFFNKNYK